MFRFKVYMKRTISSILALLGFLYASAQTDSIVKVDTSKYVKFFKVNDLEEVEELDFEQKEEPKKFKKKKPKRRVYYGFKTKKGFTKKGQGKSQTTEIFHYLKKWQTPNKYVKDIYWLDVRKLKVVKSRKFDPKYSKILHGPYKKIVNGELIEEGIYYIGTKHGRWVTYNKPKKYKFRSGDKDKTYKDEDGVKYVVEGSDTVLNYQLLRKKEKFNRGWSKTAELKYFDSERTKLKEVIPYDENKQINGDYYLYFKNGKIKLRGKVIRGVKVGKWTEYRSVKGRVKRHKIIKYPDWPETNKKPEEDEILEPEGELFREWDITGDIIFDKEERIDKRKKK